MSKKFKIWAVVGLVALVGIVFMWRAMFVEEKYPMKVDESNNYKLQVILNGDTGAGKKIGLSKEETKEINDDFNRLIRERVSVFHEVYLSAMEIESTNKSLLESYKKDKENAITKYVEHIKKNISKIDFKCEYGSVWFKYNSPLEKVQFHMLEKHFVENPEMTVYYLTPKYQASNEELDIEKAKADIVKYIMMAAPER